MYTAYPDIAFNKSLPVAISLSGAGFVDESSLQLVDAGDNKTQQQGQFGFFVNQASPGSQGQLEVEVADGLDASVAYSVARQPAASVEALLVSKEVWYDQPRQVEVVLQARDADFNVQVANSVLRVVLTPSAKLGALANPALAGQCQASASTGMCTVRINLPSQWFEGVVASDQDRVNVSYGLQGGSLQLLSEMVVVHPQQPVSLVADSVVGQMPSRDLYPGDRFSVQLSAVTGRAVEAFRLRFAVDDGLVIEDFDVAAKWSGQKRITNGKTATVSYILGDPLAAPQGQQADPQLLITVELQVAGNAPVNQALNLTVEVLFLSDIDSREIFGDGHTGQVSFLGRSAGLEDEGQAHVRSDDMVGLFAYAATAELVNVARVGGASSSSQISIVAVRASGSSSALSNNLANCASSDPQAVQVAADCSQLLVNGSETHGSDRVNISVQSSGGHQHMFAVSVWYPVLPLSVSLELDTIKPVAFWNDVSDNQCQQLRYQQSAVYVRASFGKGGNQPAQWVELTRMLRQRIGSHNSSIAKMAAVVSNGAAAAVEGVSAGQANISVAGYGGQVVGHTMASVADRNQAVRIIGLDVAVIGGVELQLSGGGQNIDRLANQSFVISGQQPQLDFEGKKARIVVSAVFADHSRRPVGLDDGLVLESLDSDVVVIDQSQVVVPVNGRSGAGELVSAKWMPNGPCNNIAVAVGRGFVEVALPAAQRSELSIQSSRLTVAGDAARAAGLPIQSDLQVVLFYPGRSVDVSKDNRTVFDLSEANGLFSVQSGSQGQPQLVTNSSAVAGGTGTLIVRFQHENVSSRISVTVAVFEELQVWAMPFPAYGGSSSVRVQQLSRILGTQPELRQQAVLGVQMVLSSGAPIGLGSNGNVAVQVLVNGSSDASNTTQAQRQGNSFVVASNVGAAAEVVAVVVSFGGQQSQQPLVVNVSDSYVQVKSIDGLSMSSGATLRGIKGSGQASAQLSLGVTLSDDTKYVSVLGGERPLPGLVTFNTSEAAAASVDASSGKVTLHDNHFELVQATARVASVNMSAQVGFACNLDPAVGDVDLGAASGVALASRQAGQTFSVDVRINAGSLVIGAADLRVLYDPQVLAVSSVTKAYQNGVFDFNDDGSGSLAFGGTVGNNEGRGQAFKIATISFRALAQGLTTVSGQVVTLAQPDLAGSPIGANGPRAFVAGNADMLVTPASRRRRHALASADTMDTRQLWQQLKQHKQAQLSLVQQQQHQQPPLLLGRQRRNNGNGSCPTGDTNGNCEFGVTDVQFVLMYLAEQGEGFVSNTGQDILTQHVAKPYTKEALDADHNGIVNEQDATFMNKVNFQLLRFVEDIQITPVANSSDCNLAVTARVLKGGDVPADGETTKLYFDFAHQSSAIQAQLQQSQGVEVQGSFVGSDKGSPSLHGALVQAQLINASSGLFGLRLPTALDLSQVGLSAVLVTNNSAGPQFKFFSGPQNNPRYGHKLDMQLSVFGQQVGITTSGQAGYNPLMDFSNLNTTVECKLGRGICDQLPCASQQFLNNSCGLGPGPEHRAQCTACTPCGEGSFRTGGCTGSQDTTCEGNSKRERPSLHLFSIFFFF